MIVVPRRASCIVKAAHDATRKTIMASVRVKEFKGQYWLEATDGKLLAIVRGPTLEIGGLMPPLLDGDWSREYLVSSGFFRDAWKGVEEGVGFASDGKIVCAVTPNGCVEAPTHDQALAALPVLERSNILMAYPNLEHAIAMSQGQGLFAARISAEHLRDIADMANTFARRDDANPTVRLLWAGINQPIIWHVEGDGGHVLEGLVTVCKDDDPESIGFEPGSQAEVKATFVKPTKPAAKGRSKR